MFILDTKYLCLGCYAKCSMHSFRICLENKQIPFCKRASLLTLKHNLLLRC